MSHKWHHLFLKEEFQRIDFPHTEETEAATTARAGHRHHVQLLTVLAAVLPAQLDGVQHVVQLKLKVIQPGHIVY